MFYFAVLVVIGLIFTPIAGQNETGNAYWEDFPIAIKPKGLTECQLISIYDAAGRWNTEIFMEGYIGPVFTFNEETKSNLTIISEEFSDPFILGQTSLSFYQNSSKIDNATISLGDKQCFYRTAVHELGHALGLDHAPKDCLGCMMNPVVPIHEGKVIELGWIRKTELEYVISQLRQALKK